MSATRHAKSAAALAFGGASVVLAGTGSGAAAVAFGICGVLLGGIGSRFNSLLFVPGVALVIGDLALAQLRHDIGPWRALLGAGASFAYAELCWLAGGRLRRGRPRELDSNLPYLVHGAAALALGSALGAIVIASRGALAGLPTSLGRAAGGLLAAGLVLVVVWRSRSVPSEAPADHAPPSPPAPLRGRDGR